MHNRNYVNKYPSFSYAEILISMMLITVILMASFSVMTIRNNKNDYNMNVVSCIKNTLPYNSGLNISESSCATYPNNPCCRSVLNCRYQRDNSCTTIQYFADNGNTNEKDYAGKLFREVCDEGGEKGCNYFAFACKDDISKCNITGDNDLHYYLSLLSNTTNVGRTFIENKIKDFYSSGYTNITTEVDNLCLNPDLNVACSVKGITTLPIEYAPSFQVAFDSDYGDEGYVLARDSSGNIYAVGKAQWEASVIKLDPYGNLIWSKNIGDSVLGGNDGHDLYVTDNGNIFVTGIVNSGYMFLTKLDTNANIIWQKVLRSSNNLTDDPYQVSVDNSENVFLSGFSNRTATNRDVFILKLNSSGNTLWQKRFNFSTLDESRGFSVDGTGNIILGTQMNNGAIVLKLDPDGNVIWRKKYTDASNLTSLNAVETDNSNNIFIAGDTRIRVGTEEPFIMKLDTDGNIIWAKGINKTSFIQTYYAGFEIANSGNIYLSGANYESAFIHKLDPNGNLIWGKQEPSKYSGYQHFACGITLDSLENIYHIGFVRQDTTDWSYILKINSNQTSQDFTTFDIKSLFTLSTPTSTSTNPGYAGTPNLVVTPLTYTAMDNPQFNFD